MPKKIIVAIILALSAVGIGGFIIPLYNTIGVDKIALDLRKERLTSRTALLAKVESLKGQYDQHVAEIEQIDAMIPVKRHEDQIVSSIQAIANSSGMNLTEINVADLLSQNDVNFKNSVINANLTGQYIQFVNFVQLIEQSLRLYNINDFTVSENNNIRGQLNFQLKINVTNLKQ